MAGMEIFGWLSALCGIFLFPAYLKDARIDCRSKLIFGLLLALFLSNVLSALSHGYSSKDVIDIIGRMRWTLLLIFLVPAVSFLSDKKLFMLLKYVVGLGFIISIYAIFQHLTGKDFIRSTNRAVTYLGEYSGGLKFYRSAGFLSSPMTFGNSFGLFVSAVVGYLLSRSIFRNKLLVSVAILGGMALYATYTRGVWFSFVCCILIAVIMLFPKRKAALLSGAASAFGVLIFIFSAAFRMRILEVFDFNYASLINRLNLWSANIAMFKDFPLLGVGYGKNEDLALTYLDRLAINTRFTGHAHNTFIQFLSGTGLVGTVIYTAISVLLLVENYKLMRGGEPHSPRTALFFGLFIAQIFLHLSGLTECSFKDAEVTHFAVVIFALILASRLKNNLRPACCAA